MDIEMVFNELSIVNPATDKFQARELMSKLVQTLTTATKNGVQRTLRTGQNINDISLTPEYSIVNWRNDPEVDREERRFLTTLINKAPYCIDVIAEIQSQFDLAEVSFQGKTSEGLRFAAITNSIAISLNSASEWNGSTLSIDLKQLSLNDEIVDSKIDIKHASSKQHIHELSPWIQECLARDIKDGKQLWLDRHQLFDRLDFCNCVEKQLTDILSAEPKLTHIIQALSTLNQRCQVWHDGNLSLAGYLDESGESESTMQNKNYRSKRTFLCPDGEQRVFERHIKLRLWNWRIHFLAQSIGTVTIGYIGSHLPTTRYST